MPLQNTDPRIDEYIAKAQPFAQPILTHLRTLIHRACPEIEETIKWGMPFFQYRGAILCNMAGFKQHCAFGFWGKEIADILREDEAVRDDAMGTLGRISSPKDLPSDKQMLTWLRRAAAFVDSGQYTSPMAARSKKAARPAPEAPSDFAAALKKNKKAATIFDAFSPGNQREYIDWITEAKRPETRVKRITTAVEWIAEGKQRNWKYQNC